MLWHHLGYTRHAIQTLNSLRLAILSRRGMVVALWGKVSRVNVIWSFVVLAPVAFAMIGMGSGVKADGQYPIEGTHYHNYKGKMVHMSRLLANGCEVFVDGSVPTDGDGTLGRPFKWFAKGVEKVPAGGTVCLNAGRYSAVGVYREPMTLGATNGTVILGPPTGPGEALRIGTYNAQFLPSLFFSSDTHDGCCEDIGGRPEKIAERILASGYDIIALNEVFTEGPKNTLVSKLKEEYPYYVKEVADSDEVFIGGAGHQDSGLMLFSRFPFEPLPRPTFKAKYVLGSNGPDHPISTGPPYWRTRGEGVVAYIEYTNRGTGCVDTDCLADKGATYVRIRNQHTGRVYNVVFTHLQAHFTKAAQNVRNAQLQVIEDLIRGTMTEEQINTEDIFLLGDLNIDGNEKWMEHRKTIEWTRHFAQGGFFNDVLRDAWHYEMHATNMSLYSRDAGVTGGVHAHWESIPLWPPSLGTQPIPQERLDYFLRNSPPMASSHLCTQHMTIAYNLRHGAPYLETGAGMAGFQDLSDHYGLNADINLQAPHCSPAQARANPPLNQWLDGQITYPGSMQWFRGGRGYHSGTYSLELRSEGPLDFQVYLSEDLSTPLPRSWSPRRGRPSGEANTTSWTYHIPSTRDFYVRVYARDPAWTGPYQLMIRQNHGKDQADAILLRANHLQTSFPDSAAPGDTIWFKILTEAPDSGLAQALRFFVSGDSPGKYAIELRDSYGATVIDESPPGNPEIRRANPADNNRRMYLPVPNLRRTPGSF